MQRKTSPTAAFLLVTICLATPVVACTNFIATRGATEDGSVIITYTCDGEFHPRLSMHEAADHAAGRMKEIRHWDGSLVGEIENAPRDHHVVQLMNEHQVVIGETTFDGRPELQNPDGLLHYWVLMNLALQRATTAREAVEIIADLVDRHGYRSTGESFSIGDENEAWIMEMVGPGPGGDGALWVARRIPDGAVCAHANLSRIREFPLDDPDGTLYEPRVIDFAVERGFHDPDSDRPFSFSEAYCPPTAQTLRYTETRVWSLFRRAAPSLELPVEFHRGVPGSRPYPLWIEPDEKLSLADVFALMRDHYEGTDYDMTRGVDAGPFGNPNRWRPMNYNVDGADYTWERPISTQQTGFSMVSQSRAWLPDAVGGCLWYGVDDTYTTCYVPLYCCITDLPEAFRTGDLQAFTWDSAWWTFNFVANYAALKYSHMIVDIQAVQAELEGNLLALQPSIDKTASDLAARDPELARDFLTSYSVSSGQSVHRRWRSLADDLLTRYNDGYVKDEEGLPAEVGYPESWLRDVIQLRPEQFLLRRGDDDSLQTVLPY